MTRLMGDAIADNAGALEQVAGLQLVAGYVTGTPDIQWTAADWALFPNLPQVTIDQGAAGSPVAGATVRDVEAGAWTAGSAVSSQPWTAPRPTIYCDQSTLPAVLQAGWQGDLWLAIIGWSPGTALPTTPGCEVVAVQYAQNVSATYDLSYVLDTTWPATGGNDVLIIWAPTGAYLLSGGKLHAVANQDDLNLYIAAGVGQAGSASGSRVSAAELTALQSDFPPGNPAVTVDTTGATYTITGTATPASA
jgi:hypothetical protein